MPDVAYVVVTFRSAADIATCIGAIDADAGQRPRPIVIVDNASDDASVTIALEHPARPLVIARDTNDGFGTACNRGTAAADAEAVFFVNPDAILTPGTTARLLDVLARDAGIAAVGPSIIDPAGGFRARSAGAEPSARSAIGHFLLLGRVPGLGRLFPSMQLGPTTAERDVDWLSGAALLVRRSAFDAVGGFDERLFLYMEDVDLCRRLREARWRVRYVPVAVVEHAMGGSQGPESVDRWYRAFVRYIRDHHGRRSAFVAGAAAFVGVAARALAYGVMPGQTAQATRMRRAARAAASSITHSA